MCDIDLQQHANRASSQSELSEKETGQVLALPFKSIQMNRRDPAPLGHRIRQARTCTSRTGPDPSIQE